MTENNTELELYKLRRALRETKIISYLMFVFILCLAFALFVTNDRVDNTSAQIDRIDDKFELYKLK